MIDLEAAAMFESARTFSIPRAVKRISKGAGSLARSAVPSGLARQKNATRRGASQAHNWRIAARMAALLGAFAMARWWMCEDKSRHWKTLAKYFLLMNQRIANLRVPEMHLPT